jgi:hypothetical protein
VSTKLLPLVEGVLVTGDQTGAVKLEAVSKEMFEGMAGHESTRLSD